VPLQLPFMRLGVSDPAVIGSGFAVVELWEYFHPAWLIQKILHFSLDRGVV